MNDTENKEKMTHQRRLTIKEFIAILGLDEKDDYLMVSAFVNFLVKMGIAEKSDEKRAQPSGRGKPSDVYVIPHEAVVQFWDEEKADNALGAIDVESKVVSVEASAAAVEATPISDAAPIIVDQSQQKENEKESPIEVISTVV